MTHFQSRITKYTGMALAVLITVTIQGSLLLGFDAASRPDSAQAAVLVTLPSVTVTATRS